MISVVLYCYMVNDWKEKLNKQINKIVSSKLYDSANELFLLVCDTDDQLLHVNNIIKDLPKIQLSHTKTNTAELFGLSKLDELARQDEERKLLYFHTKGVFNKYKNFQTKEIDELKIKGISCWVDMMEYFLVDNWKDCVNKLDDCDIVGTIKNGYWWWGNFWWTKSSHIKKIPPIKDFFRDRWTAEAWVHESCEDREKIKFYEYLPKAKHDPCFSILPRYFYDKSIDVRRINIHVIEAQYGYFSQQRDEGRPTPEKNNSIIDVTYKVRKMIENPEKIIRPAGLCDFDLAFGKEKSVRIKFFTNIDPQNSYVISSIYDNEFSFIF